MSLSGHGSLIITHTLTLIITKYLLEGVIRLRFSANGTCTVSWLGFDVSSLGFSQV
jgi:hypothetical protein